MEELVPTFENFQFDNELNEKWKDGADIKGTGEYAGKSIDELKGMQKSLRDKKERSADESTKLRQVNFAIRAKRNFKGKA